MHGYCSRLRSFNNLTSVQIFDSVVTLSCDIKLLGITFDRTLSVVKHVSKYACQPIIIFVVSVAYGLSLPRL